MPHKEAKKNIDELKQELGRIPKETGALESKLDQAMEGLEHYTPESLQNFAETVKREAEEFEVEHPQITALVNQVMTALSNIGI